MLCTRCRRPTTFPKTDTHHLYRKDLGLCASCFRLYRRGIFTVPRLQKITDPRRDGLSAEEEWCLDEGYLEINK